MNKFMQENYALIVGITLPLALMLLFFIAGNTAKVAVDDPQYDAVFAANYYGKPSEEPYDIRIDNGKLLIKPSKNGNGVSNLPQIYVFDHTTGISNRIDIDFKNIVDGMVSDPDIDALNQHKFSTDTASPDGYLFEYRYGSSSGGIAGEFFGFGRRTDKNPYALTKGPRVIRLKLPQPTYQAKLLGWIVDEKK